MQMTDLASNPDLKVVAFVHAKGTSERLPGKNLRVLGDRPLICHAIANSLAAKTVDVVVIDSDSDEILCVGEKAGAVPLKRSAELATNKTSGDDLAGCQADNVPLAEIVVQVVPTSPFVRPKSIDRAIELFRELSVDSVVAVRSERRYEWRYGQPFYSNLPNSQDLDPTMYETTGLYVIRQSYAVDHRKRINPAKCAPIYLPTIEAVDINTEEDFQFAEIVWKGLRC